MKKLLFVVVILGFTTITNAQQQNVDGSDCLIWNCKTLKKGFYKSYEEYLHNAPSIIKDFEVDGKSAINKIALGRGGDLKLIFGKGESKIKRFWGFCDGEDAYVAMQIKSNKYFWKLDFIGKNPSFNSIRHGGLLVATINVATEGVDEFINDEGKSQRASVKNLEELFASQPDLLKEFKAESDQRGKRQEYLKRFNEKSGIRK